MKTLQLQDPGNGGRFGNHLFTVASTIGLALRHGYTPRIPSAWKYRYVFDLPQAWYGQMQKGDQYVSELGYNYQDFDITGNCVTIINSYLQSPKYWEGYENEIINYLTPNGSSPGFKNAIAIHYRHGDYVQNPNYLLLPLDYYIKGMACLNIAMPVVARSDNPDYVRLHHAQECTTDLQDFIDLMECKYHIISNSTFAWWAAYLSCGKVIAPRDWFGLGLQHLSTKDLIPKKWEVI